MSAKWVTFTSASSLPLAEGWRTLLENNNIPCRIHPGDSISFMGSPITTVRLMTLSEYVERAQGILSSESH